MGRHVDLHRPLPRHEPGDRSHVRPTANRFATSGLPVLTDKGYGGAGIGILHHAEGRNLDADHRCFTRLLATNQLCGYAR